MFRCGSHVELSDLRPTPEYPETPLLLEYAGNDRSGRGHRRSRDIHILWRLNAERGEFEELARCLSQGSEWFDHMAPIARREIERGAPKPVNFADEAGAATRRVLALLDDELSALEDEGRDRVLSFLSDQFTARLVSDHYSPRSFY